METRDGVWKGRGRGLAKLARAKFQRRPTRDGHFRRHHPGGNLRRPGLSDAGYLSPGPRALGGDAKKPVTVSCHRLF